MMKLYHGSNVCIDAIDLSKSRPFKDFGKAFYLSANESMFLFDEQLMDSEELKVLRFDTYSEEWADFIFANRSRKKPVFCHDYDIVYGPIANDKVGEQVALFRGGYITKERFLRKLKLMKGITFQYAFCSELAISKLRRL